MDDGAKASFAHAASLGETVDPELQQMLAARSTAAAAVQGAQEEKKEEDFKVDDLVQMREEGEAWKTGYVTQVEPLKVRTSGGCPLTGAFSWHDVMRIRDEDAELMIVEFMRSMPCHPDWEHIAPEDHCGRIVSTFCHTFETEYDDKGGENCKIPHLKVELRRL